MESTVWKYAVEITVCSIWKEYGNYNMSFTVWKYTVESTVYSIWKEYENYNMSLLIPEQIGLRDSTALRHLYVLVLLRFDIVEKRIRIVP